LNPTIFPDKLITMKRALIVVILISLVSSCATSPTGRRQLMLISPDAAIVESKKAYLSTVSELDSQNKLVDDPVVVKRVQTITGYLVAEAVALYPHSAGWEWSVAIIDDPKTVNAWCMAGGRMAVYTGLFEKLQLTDDEFAHIMGHEISHALANHTAERMSRAMASSLGIIAIGISSDNSTATMAGAAVAAKLALELPNSRTAESEADEIGMQLATLAGYQPEAAVTLWQKMGSLDKSATPKFLSTHPSPGNRESTLAALVPEMNMLNPEHNHPAPYPIEIVK
jgi:predicted Zn-dependent protease